MSIKFGTGGIRGIMGEKPGELNERTIITATLGLGNYINREKHGERSIVIAYDSRNNSYEFALKTALTICTLGIKVYLFPSLRSTPELSFAVRKLKCDAGVMITASHNPKEYNGYKVYWNDGGQLVEPQVSGVIEEINKIKNIENFKLMTEDESLEKGLLNILNGKLDDLYIETLKKESLNEDINKEFKIIYSPLHGAGGRPVKRILDEIGYRNVYFVSEQTEPDGEFPTCAYANPEDENVFKLACKLGDEKEATLCMCTDPDADRVAMMVKDKEDWIYLNGNQTGILLMDYILKYSKKLVDPAVVSTIVTTPMLEKIAKNYNTKVFRTLTGFKYIGEKIREFEEGRYKNNFVFGMEESIGYLKGTYVRDKDGILGVMLIAEMLAFYDDKNISILEVLKKMYDQYGWYSEITHHVKKEGETGKKEIKKIMNHFRENDLEKLLDRKVIKKIDYKLQSELDLPKSNVIKYILEDETNITIRPSGTEPKIKYYIYTKGEDKNEADRKLEESLIKLNSYVDGIIRRDQC
ncbi:phospho-sugar mutase [Fusobacterium sp. MFO224]|uniref:phospho-sugar mutase n=1 Tax=Fusobacterium sp. MFO224 TaxID=3378070 RepID=UPI00385312B5